MSFELLRLYIEGAFLLTVGLGCARLSFWALNRFETRARLWAGLGYGVLVAAFMAPIAARATVRHSFGFTPPVQIWSGAGSGVSRLSIEIAGLNKSTEDSSRNWRGAVSHRMIETAGAFIEALIVLGMIRLAYTYMRLRRHCDRLPVVRRHGRTRICVSEQDVVPFSAWTGNRAYIVVPIDAVADSDRLRMIVAHEIQHLRRRDTIWVYFFGVLEAIYPWLPAARGWAVFLGRLQDLSCDQAVIERGIPPEKYGECLLRAAESWNRRSKRAPIGACLTGRGGRFFRRRIEMLVNNNHRQSRRLVHCVGALCLAIVGLAGAFGRAGIDDRRVSLAEAREIAEEVGRETGFHIPLDETVLAQLNEMIGAPERRAYWIAALERGAGVRPPIVETLRRHGLPTALAAVALFESGFRNLPPDPTGRIRGAGLWQLIPETALHYGLRVDQGIDERLDPTLASDAAARYLKDLHAEFDDWSLSVAAYTHGEGAVRAAIARTGTRDAAALVKSGELSAYSSGVLAAVLLTRRPALVQ